MGARRLSYLARVALLAAAPLLVACAGASTGQSSGDPERVSEGEYDVARDLWLRQGKSREALAHALLALEANAANADAAHLTALLYLDFCEKSPGECHLDQAERHARAALSLRSDFREARNTLGVVLTHQRRFTDAIEVLRPLTEDILYSTPENAWGNLGEAYLGLERWDDAIDALSRSVAAQPSFCVGFYRMGVAWEGKKQIAKAIEAYSRAIETEAQACRRMQIAYLARARLQLQIGAENAAREDIDQCLMLDADGQTGKDCATLQQRLK
jgi:type IV pilus assembly protein PilF